MLSRQLKRLEQVKWSVILIDRLGPDIFSTLRMKGHIHVLSFIKEARKAAVKGIIINLRPKGSEFQIFAPPKAHYF